MRSGINRPDSGNLSHLDGFSMLSNRPRISTLLSHAHDEHALNQFGDRDQIVSEELLSEEESESHLTAASAPVYDAFPSLSTSLSQDTDMSMSPAAMFLSAFSPATSLAPLPDDEGEEIDSYKLGGIIGYGGFSSIRRATDPSGGTVAVKILRRSDLSKSNNPSLARKRLNNEAAIWETLSHEHILPLFHSAHTPYADFFVMLYCPAGSLYDILKRDGRPALPHDDAGMMFRQVVRGLRYLHEVMGLVHGDIKLENVLVDEMGVCRIGDFGMARKIGGVDENEQEQELVRRQQSVNRERKPAQIIHSRRQLKTNLPVHLSLMRHHSGPRHRNSSPLPSSQTVPPPHVVYEFQPGSLPYASPELLLPSSASHPYEPHPAQDIWALGVMLFALFTGRLPFMDSFEPRLQMKILHGVFDMPAGIGRGAELVLQGCLERSVAHRWDIAAVDEVGWSVGSGPQEEESAADKEIALMVREAQQSRPASGSRSALASVSRSRSRARNIEDDAESSHLRARSSSRHTTSAISRSTSSRSNATPPPLSTPSFSALTHSIFSTFSSSSPSGGHGSSYSGFPRQPVERGRNPAKDQVRARLSSRSPSPSMAPMTPTDSLLAMDAKKHTPFILSPERNSSRGRRSFRARSEDCQHPLLRSHGVDSELDVLDETSRWTLSPDARSGSGRADSVGGSRSRSRYYIVDEDPQGLESQPAKGKRAGSTPPARTTPWNVPRSRASVELSPAMSMAHSSPHFDGLHGFTSGSTPIAIPPSGGRSRSVDVDARGSRHLLI